MGDIARVAGVSTASVSRVLNNGGRVGEQTRKRILEVAAALEYTPNLAARALASRSARVVGVVVPSLENLNFSIAVDALQTGLRDRGYGLLLSTSDYSAEKEYRRIRALAAQRVAAMVLIGTRHQAEIRDFLKARSIPLLETWTVSDGSPSIGFDNKAAGRALACHLLELGHVQIGVIAGRLLDNDRAAARIAGVREAMAERGLTLARERLVERSYRIAEGRRGLRELLQASPNVTAVICMSDTLAWGAMLEARARGLAVPERLSVTGFDDLEFASELDPALSTIHVPAREIGLSAARHLAAMLDGDAPQIPPPLDAPLVIRGTTCAPRPEARPSA